MTDRNTNENAPQQDQRLDKNQGSSEEIAALREELQKQTELAKHNLDQWKRAAADLANYRKRMEREREEEIRLANAGLMARLLPVLDDLERAFQTLPADLRGLTWFEGIAFIERKLCVTLEQMGLQEIEALGKTIDPTEHQAVLTEETTAYPDDQVMAVLQKGYRLHNQVLRPAMVKVAKNPTGEPTQAPAESSAESG